MTKEEKMSEISDKFLSIINKEVESKEASDNRWNNYYLSVISALENEIRYAESLIEGFDEILKEIE